MWIKKLAKTLFAAFSLMLFSTCGDLGTVLPVYNTYKISALINNNTQIEEYSLVQENDRLQPYCDSSIVNDPDIRGLQIIIQNSRRESISGRVRYNLNKSETSPADNLYTDSENTPGEDNGDTPPEPQPGTGTQERSGEGSPGEAALPEAEEQEKTVQQTEESETGETGLTDKEEQDGIPAEIQGGIPGGEQEEKTVEIPVNAIPVSVPRIGDEEIVFEVDHLDSRLPAFSLPEDLRIGAYTMQIRVMGENDILGEVTLPFYYIGNAKFALKDIALYLPGASSESRLIPPGTTVLLEAKVEADARLNPYIVWYNGKKPIEEGRLSDNAGLIFWQASEQTSFQSLRAEIFPSQNIAGLKGISREIILPVSSKAASADFFMDQRLVYFSETEPEAEPDKNSEGEAVEGEEKLPVAPLTARFSDMYHRYKFAASLKDSQNPLLAENALSPVFEKEPRWKPMTYSYGLSTGAHDTYNLPPLTFVKKNEEQGGGLFLFRIKPIAEGTVLNAVISSKNTSEQATVEVTINKGNLTLSLGSTETHPKEISIPIPGISGKDYPVITAAIALYFFPEYIEARLIMERNSLAETGNLKIRVSSLMDGVCRVSMGKAAAPVADESAAEETETQSKDRENSRRNNRKYPGNRNLPETAVWDQLTILYVKAPEPSVPEIEIDETADEAPASKDETAVDPKKEAVSEPTKNNPETQKNENEQAPSADTQEEAKKAESPIQKSAILNKDQLTSPRDGS